MEFCNQKIVLMRCCKIAKLAESVSACETLPIVRKVRVSLVAITGETLSGNVIRLNYCR